MKNITKGALALLAFSLLTVGANAAPKKMAKSMVCPFCHMKMMTTKSKAAPVAVKIKGTTYYCCTGCHKKK